MGALFFKKRKTLINYVAQKFPVCFWGNSKHFYKHSGCWGTCNNSGTSVESIFVEVKHANLLQTTQKNIFSITYH